MNKLAVAITNTKKEYATAKNDTELVKRLREDEAVYKNKDEHYETEAKAEGAELKMESVEHHVEVIARRRGNLRPHVHLHVVLEHALHHMLVCHAHRSTHLAHASIANQWLIVAFGSCSQEHEGHVSNVSNASNVTWLAEAAAAMDSNNADEVAAANAKAKAKVGRQLSHHSPLTAPLHPAQLALRNSRSRNSPSTHQPALRLLAAAGAEASQPDGRATQGGPAQPAGEGAAGGGRGAQQGAGRAAGGHHEEAGGGA